MEPARKRCPKCTMLQPEEQGVCSVCGHSFTDEKPFSPIAPVLLLVLIGVPAACLAALGAYFLFIALIFASDDRRVSGIGATGALTAIIGGTIFGLSYGRRSPCFADGREASHIEVSPTAVTSIHDR